MSSNDDSTDVSFCEDCGRENLQQYHKYCRRCGAKNPSFLKSSEKIAEPTETEIKLARRLFAEGLDFILSPEIWYSSCTFYTPDFLVEGKLIVEIDGGIHGKPHQVLMDRIRQRALENSGYPVCRFTNKEVNKSLESIVRKIISQLRTLETITQTNIIEIDVPKEHRFSNIHQEILKKHAHELCKITITDNWNTNTFKDFFSNVLPAPNRCAMQRMMQMLLGLNFRATEDGSADFQNYAKLFKKVTSILDEFFGEIAIVEFRNEFNITATNFLKNLVFYGKPRILSHRIIDIKNYDDVQNLIKNFNSNFSVFGISVLEDDLRTECIHEKMKEIDMIPKEVRPNNLRKFDWIEKWEIEHV